MPIRCRYTHLLGDKQWEYKDWISEQCGPDVAKTEPWRRQMYEATGQNKREFPDRYAKSSTLTATSCHPASVMLCFWP